MHTLHAHAARAICRPIPIPIPISRSITIQAARAISNLSSNERIKRSLVQNGALGYLISMSKSEKGA
jgi:hypothetical protein